jgi:Mrp family chromosome partitioning ATPase
MHQLLAEVSKRFDVVLVDSPPVLGVSDASLLVSKVDATLVVLQPRNMPLKALLRTKSIIQNVGGQIMGLVMNNVDISADTQYQYYTTYYSYYTNDNQRKEPNVGAPRPAESLASSTAAAPTAVLRKEEPKPSSDSDADLY